MNVCRFLLCAATSLTITCGTHAAIIPSWRINQITPAAIANDPQLADAGSLSLIVTLTGDSLFNVAGLNLQSNFQFSSVTVYQNTFGSNTDKPNPGLAAVFPALTFDSYVSTTLGNGNAASAPGTYSGAPGNPVFGPTSIDVVWYATPNTGPLGGVDLEIARITLLNTHGGISPIRIPVSGEVRDSLAPNTAIAVPPMFAPYAWVPEPASAAGIGLAIMTARRRRR